jgi:hypothetical protein
MILMPIKLDNKIEYYSCNAVEKKFLQNVNKNGVGGQHHSPAALPPGKGR